ncbi:MAG: hypothetical protein BWX47_01137 [candidate division Hyd24-12 bacterium ADurb.Bin004]|nr:MAG: hypothetical protein BWX47_01137 [candidate division Hyd24-12 bacterium ADurb.Bin004]
MLLPGDRLPGGSAGNAPGPTAMPANRFGGGSTGGGFMASSPAGGAGANRRPKQCERYDRWFRHRRMGDPGGR